MTKAPFVRHIGGSRLPSSDSHILSPLGNYRVVALPDLDTHALKHNGSIIAMHPNGYSCRALAERMHAGNKERALQQHAYILDCGGQAVKADTIVNIIDFEGGR